MNQEESKTTIKKKGNLALKIIIIIAVVIITLFAIATCMAVAVINSIDNEFKKISNKLNERKEAEKIREDTYDSIPKELISKKMIPENWKYVDSAYGWSGEHYDKEDKYYFYIEEELYNLYKYYWLEGVESSEFSKDYNKELGECGSQVFHLINVQSLSYSSDIDYGNVQMYKDKTYYLVEIYEKAIYYKYIPRFKDINNYAIMSAFKYDRDSLLKEYIFYKDNNEWIIEELYR